MDTLAPARAVIDERDAFADLVRPHWEILAALSRRLAPIGSADSSADDVLQDALTAAWRKRDQFDAAKGSARNWLLAIVADQAYKGRRRLRPAVPLTDVAAPATASDRDVDLRRALAALTHRQRSAVALFYYVGLPVAEVAVVLRCSEGTVKSTLSDARARLRALLGEDYE